MIIFINSPLSSTVTKSQAEIDLALAVVMPFNHAVTACPTQLAFSYLLVFYSSELASVIFSCVTNAFI